MEYRPYGQTGEDVSLIGLGGACLDHSSYADGVATVRRALELGVSYFDTSPFYGNGASQAILGEALEGKSEKYLLATKIGHLAEADDFRSPAKLWAQFQENLRVLRRQRVGTLQIHESDWPLWWSDHPAPYEGAIRDDYDFVNAPVMQVLREAKQRGLCRFIGLTGNSADETAGVLAQVDVDTYLPAFNYDLIRRSLRRQALPLARRKGVALILGGVFRDGRLAQVHPEWLSSPPDWMSPEFLERLGRLYALQKECGLSLVTLTIRYLVAEPAFSTILVGAGTPENLEECVVAGQAGALPDELQRAVEALGLP